MMDKNLGKPDVALSFELDGNGIAQIAKAEATFEEEVEVEMLVKEEKKIMKFKKYKNEDSSTDSREASDEGRPKEKQMKQRYKNLMVVRAYESQKAVNNRRWLNGQEKPREHQSGRDGEVAEAVVYKKKMLKELTIAMTTAQEYAFNTPELVDDWSTGKPQMTNEERSDVVEKIDELEAWLTE
ncbi:hypothetical protein JG687_00016629 [Phytophthora cactorum]|uniref:Uncharacterized protein n=2 Tax=Phytophthora cactorum TaxID=29920 RepID=A0A8T1TU04_9STRA|nr:hypothetical protein JG687_00016629 [Phytophthora cactorum]